MAGDHDYARLLGEAAAETITDTFRLGRWLLGLGSQQRARKRAAAKALADEQASRAQQRKWHEEVARQHTRGRAGFASEAEARAALSGKGGRPNKLDGRKFR
jgi:hypothetical protein